MMNDALHKVKPAAIALIVAGCLSGGTGLLSLLGGLFRLARGTEILPTKEAERLGFMIATVGTYGISLISLVLAPVIIYGAVQMMQGKKYGLSKTAAILAIVPVTSCCFLIGIPAGIWSLIVLARPDVKAAFAGEDLPGNFYPPRPPQNW